MEQLIGTGIFLSLIVLGAFIWLKGQRFDPNRFALDPAALESTRVDVEGKAATLRADDMRGFELTGSGAAPSATAQAKVLPAMVEGFSPMGPTEHYQPDTLFEKINGRAPAYLDFNFQELTCRSFTMDASPGQFIDVFIFTMESPLKAFGIFSLEREEAAVPVDFVQDGYASKMGYFFRQGKAYVQVLASDSAPSIMEPAEAFARALAASLPADDSGLGAKSLLPVTYQVPDSVTYIQSDGFGLSQLNNIYEARYNLGGTILNFFIMKAASPDEAAPAWEQLENFNRDYARITDRGELAGARYLVAENFGEWNVLFTFEGVIGGVMNAPDRDLAFEFINAYLTDTPLPYPEVTDAPESAEAAPAPAYGEENY